MTVCCVRGCENQQTKRYNLTAPPSVRKGQHPKKYVADICEPCAETLDKPFAYSYYQGGRIGFINEIWTEN